MKEDFLAVECFVVLLLILPRIRLELVSWRSSSVVRQRKYLFAADLVVPKVWSIWITPALSSVVSTLVLGGRAASTSAPAPSWESEISIDAMELQRGGVHCPMATAELKLLGTLVLIIVWSGW